MSLRLINFIAADGAKCRAKRSLDSNKIVLFLISESNQYSTTCGGLFESFIDPLSELTAEIKLNIISKTTNQYNSTLTLPSNHSSSSFSHSTNQTLITCKCTCKSLCTSTPPGQYNFKLISHPALTMINYHLLDLWP